MNRNLTLAICFLLIASSCNSKRNRQLSDPLTVSLSENFIPEDSAAKMVGSYVASLPVGDTGDLHALIFKADDLKEYLNDSSITYVKVSFAHTLAYINSGLEGQPAGYRQNELTLVIYGVDRNGNIVPAGNNLILNRADPCPPLCPGSL